MGVVVYKPSKARFRFFGTVIPKPDSSSTCLVFPVGTDITEIGGALAMQEDGSRMLVAAKKTFNATKHAAHIISFVREGSVWMKEQEISSIFNIGGQSSNIKLSMSGDGNYFVISGSSDYTNPPVYIYKRNGNVWTKTDTIIGSGLRGFGSSVSLSQDGKTLAVGSNDTPYPNVISGYTATRQGGVYIYYLNEGIYSGASGTYDALIAGQSTMTMFGSAVALSGDGTRLVVSAPRYYGNYPNNIGRIYIYKRNANNTWTYEIGQASATASSTEMPKVSYNGKRILFLSTLHNTLNVMTFETSWSMSSIFKLHTDNVTRYPVYNYSLSEDGNTIVAGFGGGVIAAGGVGTVKYTYVEGNWTTTNMAVTSTLQGSYAASSDLSRLAQGMIFYNNSYKGCVQLIPY